MEDVGKKLRLGYKHPLWMWTVILVEVLEFNGTFALARGLSMVLALVHGFTLFFSGGFKICLVQLS